jgi:cytochrome b pre-mRNA-processing protein 3
MIFKRMALPWGCDNSTTRKQQKPLGVKCIMSIASALRHLLVKKSDPATSALYAASVTAARQPAFYVRLGVPDSVDGRFDLLLLHVLLVMRRLGNAAAKQSLFDLMFADMDRSLREMGVGDMSIGKKMKPMLAGFYGRAAAYEKALATTGDEDLSAALSRNLYGLATGRAEHAPDIARYVRTSVAALAAQNETDLEQGRVAFASLKYDEERSNE